MKKLFTILFAAMASVGTLFAESGTCGENLTWDFDLGKRILTISGTGTMTNYSSVSDENRPPSPTIFEHLVIENGVTSIGDFAFQICAYFAVASIPNGVKSIGAFAFADCTSLTSVEIPNSVTSIGDGAFDMCTHLTSVTISNSVTSIGSDVFYKCCINAIHFMGTIEEWVNKTWSPSSMSSSYDLYIQNDKITEVTIPNSVTSIGDRAFSNCSSLTSVTIPNSVTSIGEHAFCNCSSLTSVTIPNSVKSIEACAFWGCSGLTTVTIPNSVTDIKSSTFRNCTGLTSVEIPNSVTSIGKDAFLGCSSLTTVTIPNNVTNIEGDAFYYCTSLNTIYNHSTIPQVIESSVFYGVNKSSCRLIVPKGTVHLYKAAEVWKDFLIEEEVCIGGFGMCGENMEWVLNCDSTEMEIRGWGDMDNFEKDKAPWFDAKESIKAVYLLKRPTSIGDYAFSNCSEIKKIHIPESITAIGKGAFNNCKKLTSITCDAVTPPVCGANAFAGVDKTIPLYVPKQSVDLYKIAEQWKDFFVEEKPEITYDRVQIGDLYYNLNAYNNTAEVTYKSVYTDEIGAWYYNTDENYEGYWDITTANIPEYVVYNGNDYCVTSIRSLAFYNCPFLSSVTIPNSLTRVGGLAFWQCNRLQSPVYSERVFAYLPSSYSGAYSIPEGIEFISGFAGCTNVTAVEIPNSATCIGVNAFDWCFNLTSITIPNNVTRIEGSAFEQCTSLRFMSIGNSVTDIENYAFSMCTALDTIYNYATTPQAIDSTVFLGVDRSKCCLFVPKSSLQLYQSAEIWKEFGALLPISAQETETTEVEIITTTQAVDITWPSVTGAATYELVIKDKSGNVICTLIFNAQGQLVSIASNAPSRDGAPQHTQVAGFSFTVTGLEAGTSYDLTIIAKDENGQEIDKKDISFHTDSPQGIEDLHIDSDKSVKVLMDGQIYILRGDKIYTATGAEVK